MSKEKQIEEMAEYIFGNAITHDTRFKEDCRSIAIDLYNAGYRKQEWISVDERLPEEGGAYLIVVKEKYESEKEWRYHVDVASFTFDWDCIFHDWDEGQGIHITHWMPLPPPPKENKND